MYSLSIIFICILFIENGLRILSFRIHSTTNSLKLLKNNINLRTRLEVTKNKPLVVKDEFVIDEEALIDRINSDIFKIEGFKLDDLLNPSTVVNLERELLQLNNRLSSTKNPTEIDEINQKIEKNEKKLFVEKRSVMRGWLKYVFLGQSALAIVASLGMVYDMIPGYDHLPLAIKVLGFWMWWLFIIPSLRYSNKFNFWYINFV